MHAPAEPPSSEHHTWLPDEADQVNLAVVDPVVAGGCDVTTMVTRDGFGCASAARGANMAATSPKASRWRTTAA